MATYQNNALCDEMKTHRIWWRHEDRWLAVPDVIPKQAAERRAEAWKAQHPEREYTALPEGILPT
jgi:hypothetical protein